MSDSATIIKSNAASTTIIHPNPPCNTEANAILEILFNKSSCGITNGKPRIAISAALCCARAAIAARKVKTRLRLMPPKQLITKKTTASGIGSPNISTNKTRLSNDIKSISSALNNNFDKMKFAAPVIV